jgi:hypothetical protein
VRRLALAIVVACIVVLATQTSAESADRLVPTPIGVGSRFHPRALTVSVVRGRQVGRLRCTTTSSRRFGVHLEIFGRGLVAIVPAGIGVARPWHALRPHVIDGACSYPARTRTSIGVIEVARGSTITLGEFFELWGQPLGTRRLAGFRAKRGEHVRAYVDGSRWRGPVRAIPLRRHEAVALELGAYVRPHPTFLFGMGL